MPARRRAIALALALLAVVLVPLAAASPAAAADGDPPRCPTAGLGRMAVVGAGPGAAVLYDRDQPGHARAARRIAGEIATRIYPRFKRLLGRTPPSDARERCPHGPDGRLDVYLTGDRRFAGTTFPDDVVAFVRPYVPREPCVARRPVFAVVRPGVRDAVLAHEVFHAFQAAYPTRQGCHIYHEWSEASATWAGDWVYPTDDIEHGHVGAFETPDMFINYWGYGTWVFLRSVTERHGAAVIRRIEEAKARHPDTRHVDAAIPGGFRARFPQFAVDAWNRRPMPGVPGRSFKQWDRIEPGARFSTARVGLGGASARTTRIAVPRLRSLGREYRRVVVGDERVRRLTFVNPQFAKPNYHVRALVRRGDGRWTSESWDGRERVEFCRDTPEEDVREVVLVLSNSSLHAKARVAPTPRVEAEDSCALRYRVLEARLSLSTVASGPSILCETIAGTKRFDGSATGLPFDPENRLGPDGGEVEGEISARVPATWHGHHLDGCRSSPRGKVRCAVDMPDRVPGGDGRWPISFSVSGGWRDPEWTLRWGHDHAEVGFVDAGDPECNVRISGAFDQARAVRREPRERFLGTQPVTFVFEGNGRPETIFDGGGATINHQWSYVLTIQRVDAAGNPLA